MAKTEFKALTPADIVAVFDSREQLPYVLDPIRSERGSLPTGDYSLKGFENYIAIERKSLPDIVSCCGYERERFEREMVRLKAYPVQALIIESTWEEVLAGGWKSKIHPNSVYGSLIGWLERGINVVMAGSRERGQHITASLLFTCARRRWEELCHLQKNLRIQRVVTHERAINQGHSQRSLTGDKEQNIAGDSANRPDGCNHSPSPIDDAGPQQ